MMFLHKGEILLGTYPAKLRHGQADIHVSNMRVIIEEYKLGCIMSLSFNDMDSCTLSIQSKNKKKMLLTLTHTDCRYAEIHTKEAEKLTALINSAHADYKSALVNMGAITEDKV